MKRSASRQFSDPSSGPASQNAALCWRMHRGRVQVLLITSRDTGRWILPKGWPMPGKTAAETAATEAWEEAGAQGDLSDAAFGYYAYLKLGTVQGDIPCMVSLFALRVTALAAKFPERKQRRRKWFDAIKAAHKVAEPELRTMLMSLMVQDGHLVSVPMPANPA